MKKKNNHPGIGDHRQGFGNFHCCLMNAVQQVGSDMNQKSKYDTMSILAKILMEIPTTHAATLNTYCANTIKISCAIFLGFAYTASVAALFFDTFFWQTPSHSGTHR